MNSHGWSELFRDAAVDFADGTTAQVSRASYAPIVDDRHRCGCYTNQCTRVATQEDLLCDECRAYCDQATGVDVP